MPEGIITQSNDVVIRKTGLGNPLIEIPCPLGLATSFYMQNDALFLSYLNCFV